jgi:hypothetical protein
MKYSDSIKERIRVLENKVYGLERKKVFEGGASGHMKHIYDYTELTLNDIKDIITSLLSGKVEDVTEKLDGMNIQCALNNNGQVVFVRNKGDLNSDVGGMLQDDVAAKWAGRENVANVYLSAYDTITKVFKNVGKEFFNPDKNTKILANCECITAGKTNILMYANAQVDFHNLWVYTREDESSPWQKSDVITSGDKIKTLEKACENIDGAQLTPRVIIKVTEKSDSLRDTYVSQIDTIFKEAGCSDTSTIEDYKRTRFNDICNKKYTWITQSIEGQDALFARWFNDDKSVKLTVIRKMYADYADELANVDYKKIVAECMRPLDTFFSRFGNAIISLCDGIVNAGAESEVIDALSSDLEEVVNEVREKGSVELNDKLTTQLNRLAELGNQLNATEGIVFKYGGRLMKATGSFAALNQALGLKWSI